MGYPPPPSDPPLVILPCLTMTLSKKKYDREKANKFLRTLLDKKIEKHEMFTSSSFFSFDIDFKDMKKIGTVFKFWEE